MNKKNFILILVISLLCVTDSYGITFIQGVIQNWFTTIRNKTTIKLAITDITYYPDHTDRKSVIISPNDQYQTLWLTTALGRDYNSQRRLGNQEVMTTETPLGREILIQGACRGSTVFTNELVIGNTTRSKYAAVPGGTFVIVSPKQCQIGIAVPYDTHHVQ